MRRMRFLLLALSAITSSTAVAQQPAPRSGSNWARVQALSPGTKIYISASGGGAHCYFKSADEDKLTCVKQADLVFAREAVMSVKIDHRGRSALAGFALGVGVGVGAVEGAYNTSWYPFRRGNTAVLVGGALGGAGALIGNFTDFTRSTVYKAR